MKMGRCIFRIAIVAVALAGCASRLSAQASFSSWPAGTSPQEVGKQVAERFIATPHQKQTGKQPVYPEICVWYGALTFARITDDKALTAKLIARFQPLLDHRATEPLPEMGNHVDLSVFGALPLELYIQTKDPKYLELGQQYADQQWAKPDAHGMTDETRYWVDDMYMITILQVQAFRATGETKYLDRAALQMVSYLDAMQQPNGLFFHAPDAPFYWGRGNGWFAAGMAELLRDLPVHDPRRPRILGGYRRMMAGLLKYQGKDGMWRQLIDHDEAWPESSASGMFAFAMITGVKNGWLDEAVYGPAARKAWLGLVGYIDQNGDVTNVCAGTNKSDSAEYYLMRNRRTGDFHGQAPVLWAATALLR